MVIHFSQAAPIRTLFGILKISWPNLLNNRGSKIISASNKAQQRSRRHCGAALLRQTIKYSRKRALKRFRVMEYAVVLTILRNIIENIINHYQYQPTLLHDGYVGMGVCLWFVDEIGNYSHIKSYMKQYLLILALLFLCSCDTWHVHVAGSNTYSNYRHQSDVFHAYQLSRKAGIPEDRIILLAYDDIANSTSNPFRGKVFNKPTYQNPGVDVYEGVKIDYSHSHVTPEVFLAVLEGNKTAVHGKGTGRVVESTANDNIFVYFADHGAPGLVAFPNGQKLYGDKQLACFQRMQGRYAKLVYYMEACESGSMFQKLPTTTRIYALSASNPTESSWGCYCSPDDVVQGKHIRSCLGDLFSINYLEDTDKGDFDQSLEHQFQTIKTETKKSHVMQWGDMSFKDERIGNFMQGDRRANIKAALEPKLRLLRPLRHASSKKLREVKQSSVMASRTMKLQSLAASYALDHSAETFAAMRKEMESMRNYDRVFEAFSLKLAVSGQYDPASINFDCLRAGVERFESQCEVFSDYGLDKIKFIAHACESRPVEAVLAAITC